MTELLLVNPIQKGKTMAKKHRSPAQKAATRRMLSARWGKKISRRARVNPIVKAKKRGRRKSYKTAFKRRYRRATRGFNVKSFANNTLMPAAIGGIGAVGLDVILAMLPLPAAVKTGPMKPIAKIAGAVGLGMIAGMVAGRKFGEQVTAGAVTVTLYEMIKGFVQKTMPTVPLSYYGDDDPLSYVQSGEVLQDNGVSAYISDDTISEYDTNYDEMSAYVS